MAKASKTTVKKGKPASAAKNKAAAKSPAKAKSPVKAGAKTKAKDKDAKDKATKAKAAKGKAAKTAPAKAKTKAKSKAPKAKATKVVAKPAATAAKKPAATSKAAPAKKPAASRQPAAPKAAAPAVADVPKPQRAAKPKAPRKPKVEAAETVEIETVEIEVFEIEAPESEAAEGEIAETSAPEEVSAAAPAAVAPADNNTFYVTTAIAYPNGNPHIGHAYEAIATDAIARFARLDGKDVFFLTGTDEHGLKMVQTAQNEGLTPGELATRNAGRFRDMDERLNVSFDRFIRTTEPAHHKSVQAIWNRMLENGDIYADTYAGWYSVRDEAYYAEDETVVGEDNVRRGPQGTPVEWVEEKSYFFRLSAYQDRLLALYESQPDFIGPDARRNEIISFVKGGLKDLSISRTTFDWGVRVPHDDEHVMYVWVDALTNYITGVGFPDENDANWKYWPADVHVIGKDIIRFHAVYWPAFLMSAGVPVPKRVYAHGFLFNRGEKMSKSVGNVVDPFNLADQYGVDQLRYFFLREVPFGQDGNYNHEAIVARINADLANDLGNLAQRSLSMIAKQLGGQLPEPGEFSANDRAILAEADAMIGAARKAMATQQIHQWLNAVWSVVAEANRYFAGEAPWALAKTDPKRQHTVLYVTAEVIRQVAILTQPVMPTASAKLLDSLGIPEDERNFARLGGEIRIAAGTQLPAPQAVFPRYIEPTAA
ncbi:MULTISPECIES: methionine--tRNA ligase [Bradyrhizobium]|uniref:Methionine--tRNA ligase n=2 Tax=Bradyrhizobium TaxID=374 RepID=A0ABS5G4I1_9BRAD|nr:MULTISPECIES: methionine--tRNA ligase [Bradyrhizobium]MBR1136220.1 methionine--tRNA ligase [Bradyrhizobium denitrificans]MDU1495755.1 methionine--tRNA ligase [Bradyrhizobium sp.]MDU1545906.1 methionine--tRNA ligase [Bradyrhizobium sp.]MDU2926880.1 methionine--tRNA ligase [Bradyrhizobium sp.]MDU3093148.1 methionine--tRNA ligase [Bradyrhizobium sp.]